MPDLTLIGAFLPCRPILIDLLATEESARGTKPAVPYTSPGAYTDESAKFAGLYSDGISKFPSESWFRFSMYVSSYSLSSTKLEPNRE